MDQEAKTSTSKGRQASKKRKAEPEAEQEEEEKEMECPIFDGVKFVLLGELSKPHEEWTKVIQEQGGSVLSKGVSR